jgi:hypothetical protein
MRSPGSGRCSAAATSSSTSSGTSRWSRRGCALARAVAADDLSGAADVFDDIGASTFVAFYRLRAAERLLAEGRRAEADVQLAPALPFYRSVGATRYVREGEALLAASA